MAMRGTPYLIPGSTQTQANIKGETTSSRTYRCEFDPEDSDFFVIRNLPPGLQRWTSDPGWIGFVVIDVQVNDDAVGLVPSETIPDLAVRRWNVAVTYGPWSPALNSPDGNPLNEPPQAWFEATEEQIPVLVDNQQQPVLNGVGDPYDPGLQRQNTVRTLVISQNFKSYNLDDILTNWKDCVNQTPWKNFAARTLLLAPLNAPKAEYCQELGFTYYRFEFRFLLNPDTHDKQVLNQGMRYYDQTQDSTGQDALGNPTYPLANVTIDGEAAQLPVLLSYPDGQPMFAPIDKDNIQINTHKVYNEVDFNAMPFANVYIPDGIWQ